MTGYNRVLAYTGTGTIIRSELVADADTEAVHDEFMSIPGVQGVTSIAFDASAFRSPPQAYRSGSGVVMTPVTPHASSLYSGPEVS